MAIQKMGVEKTNLWEKWQDGSMSREEYVSASGGLSARIGEYEESIRKNEDRIRHLQSEKGREYLFVERFAKHTGIQRLTREIVDKLVQAVYVYDRKHIEIVFNYADEYAVLIQEMDADNDKEMRSETA